MINSDLNVGGIHRAFIVTVAGDVRIYIPGLTSLIAGTGSVVNEDGTVNTESYNENKETLPRPIWCLPNLEAKQHDEVHPCWVTFENGDSKRPIIMGFLGKGIKYHANSSEGSGSSSESTNDGSEINNSGTNINVNAGNWLSIVQAVKQAVASQKPGYSWYNYITITINGMTIKTRTDCSGVVSAMLQAYGSYSPGTMTSTHYMTSAPPGFTKMAWPGWDKLQPGDILIDVNSHTEVYAGSDKKVYNAGSTSSINNPNATTSGHSSYDHIWRPN